MTLLDKTEFRRRCAQRRTAGLFLPALHLDEASMRELGAYPERNRGDDVIGWLFPNAESLARADQDQAAR